MTVTIGHYGEAQWRKVCERNDNSWVLGHNAWKMAWSPPSVVERLAASSDYDWARFLPDGSQRGFVLLCGFNNPARRRCLEIHHALVDARYRRQGVCRQLIEEVIRQYPDYTLELEALDANLVAVWSRMGFVRTEKPPEQRISIGLPTVSMVRPPGPMQKRGSQSAA
jgi:GNAT superfamily N-acetyltransferase